MRRKVIAYFIIPALIAGTGMLVNCRWGCSRKVVKCEDDADQLVDLKYCKDGVVREIRMLKRELPRHGELPHGA